MAEYNKIGQHYNLNRAADPRIVNQLIDFIDAPKHSKIIDIGAGTGNYTNKLADYGFIIDAIEPSKRMIEQAKKHPNVKWLMNSAEKMDLQKKFYDGAITSLAIHHFNSLEISFSNIYQTLKNDKHVVIFGADPRKIDRNCWLKEYFGTLIDKAIDSYVEVSELILKLESIFKNKVEYIPYPIPFDITDGFFYAGWQEPEKYLDKNFRNSISVFAKSTEKSTQMAIDKLKLDIENGTWDKKYGAVRKLKVYNGGYYFLKVTKQYGHN